MAAMGSGDLTAPLFGGVDVVGPIPQRWQTSAIDISGTMTSVLYAPANPVSAAPIMRDDFVTYTGVRFSETPGA